eukprot:PhF_6_TR27372/c0_g1_i1/m.40269
MKKWEVAVWEHRGRGGRKRSSSHCECLFFFLQRRSNTRIQYILLGKYGKRKQSQKSNQKLMNRKRKKKKRKEKKKGRCKAQMNTTERMMNQKHKRNKNKM